MPHEQGDSPPHNQQTAMRVTKEDGKIILREQVDPNFPRDSMGQVLW